MKLKAKLSISIALFIFCASSFSFGATIRITPSEGFEAIQKAINNASSGDVIFIQAGTYKSDKPLKIVNKNGIRIMSEGVVKLVSTSTTNNVVEIVNSTSIKVENIHATHIPASTGCMGHVFIIDNAKDISISYCEINGCGVMGIAMYKSSDIKITGNFIHNNSYIGISADKSSNIYVKKNLLLNNYLGIYFNEVNNVFILSNRFENNRGDNYSITNARHVILKNNIPDSVNRRSGS